MKQLTITLRQSRYVLLEQALLLGFVQQLCQSPAMIFMQHLTCVMPRDLRVFHL